MAEAYGIFDAGAGSAVTEGLYRRIMRAVALAVQSGVITGLPSPYSANLAVSGDSTGMQVKMQAGAVWLDGFYYDNDALLTWTGIAANASGNPRIDLCVIQADPTTNIVQRVIKQGTPSATPVAPSVTQSATGVWEEPLAEVLVGNGVATITSGNVTDRRIFANRASNALAGNYPSPTLATDSVGAAQILADAVGASEIAAAAVGTSELADAGVTAAKLATGAVTAAAIAADTITASQIAPNAVGSSELADNAVDTPAIQDGAVTAAKLTGGGVGTTTIQDGAVTTAKLAANAVTAPKLGTLPQCIVNRTSGQTIATVTTAAITFPTGSASEDRDTDTMHDMSTNTERLTATTAGWYDVEAFASVGPATFSGRVRLDLFKVGGAAFSGQEALPTASSSAQIPLSCSGQIYLAVAEAVAMQVLNSTPGNVTVTGRLSATWVGA